MKERQIVFYLNFWEKKKIKYKREQKRDNHLESSYTSEKLSSLLPSVQSKGRGWSRVGFHLVNNILTKVSKGGGHS